VECTYPSLITEKPLLSELLPKHQLKVLTKLSTDIPLKITAPLISDEQYWERCCRARWQLCDVSDYDHNWKRMFFERNAQEAVETFVPDQNDIMQVCALRYYPACVHAQQGVKQSVCMSVCRLSSARSRHLGVSATRKHNKSIELGEKLASVCFKSRDMIHESHK
jgi:hypothetical protein